jgi:ABC-type Fe3+ transport system permease subunit
MKRLSLFVAASLSVFSMALVMLQPATVNAAPKDEITNAVNAIDERESTCGPEGAKRKCTLNDTLASIVNVLLFIIGAVAVIMIVVGGLKYTTSNGDSSAVTSAKNTILYAVVGLVVAILAYAIVNFVLNQF